MANLRVFATGDLGLDKLPVVRIEYLDAYWFPFTYCSRLSLSKNRYSEEAIATMDSHFSPGTLEITGTIIFACAILHTFSTGFFQRIALRYPRHSALWHLLGEAEIIFGVWAAIFTVLLFCLGESQQVLRYLDSRDVSQPMFCLAIMIMAGTRAILQASMAAVDALVHLLPLPKGVAFYFCATALVPLLGSLMTEPGAMALAALILGNTVFKTSTPARLKYATLGILFVNVSIGGVLTSFAAPPVVMIASKWQWDTSFMFLNIGWKAALAVSINAMCGALYFREELETLEHLTTRTKAWVPLSLMVFNIVMMIGVVRFSQHSLVFMGIFLFFVGVSFAYEEHQDRLMLREGLLVAFFLSGLVVLGPLQQWWLQPLLSGLGNAPIFWGATALTAITDNAALTFLGSLIEDMAPDLKYALLTGAVTGGGLTIIANAPNPVGVAILRRFFPNEVISPLGLFLGALPPTVVAALAFRLL